MADSNALRQKRKHLHAKGDHSLCVPSRCGGKLALLRALPEATEEASFAGPDAAKEPPDYGPMTERAMDVIASLTYQLDEDDPRLLIGYLVVEMAKSFDQTRSPSLAKEVASELRWLLDHQEGEADVAARIKARVVRKQAGILIDFANQQFADARDG